MPTEPLDILIRVREQMGPGTNSAIAQMRRLRGEMGAMNRESRGGMFGGISRGAVGRLGRMAALGIGIPEIIGGGIGNKGDTTAARINAATQSISQMGTMLGMLVAFANPVAGLALVIGSQLAPALLGTADAAKRAEEAVSALDVAIKAVAATRREVAMHGMKGDERAMFLGESAAGERYQAAAQAEATARGMKGGGGGPQWIWDVNAREEAMAKASAAAGELRGLARQRYEQVQADVENDRATRIKQLEADITQERLQNEGRVFEARRAHIRDALEQELDSAQTAEERQLIEQRAALRLRGIDIDERRQATAVPAAATRFDVPALAPAMEDRYLTGVRESAMEKAITDPLVTILTATNAILTRINDRGIVLAPARLGGR
jgi:hypothetical protein